MSPAPATANRRLLAVITCAIAVTGCGEPPPTGLCVTAKFPLDRAIDQLDFRVLASDGSPRFQSHGLPKQVKAPFTAGEQDVCIRLAGADGGKDFTARVDGLAAGRLLARGGTTATARRNEIVKVTVVLGGAAGGPPAETAGCADGGREGFLDDSSFPATAACADEAGELLSYQQALLRAGGLCQAGWHLCKPAEVSRLPTMPEPTFHADGTCAWVQFETSACRAIDVFATPACSLFPIASGSAEGNGPCVLPRDGQPTGCDAGWRLAARLSNWANAGVRDQNLCHPHVGVACARVRSTGVKSPKKH